MIKIRIVGRMPDGKVLCKLTTRGLPNIEDHTDDDFVASPTDRHGLGPIIWDMIQKGETRRMFPANEGNGG